MLSPLSFGLGALTLHNTAGSQEQKTCQETFWGLFITPYWIYGYLEHGAAHAKTLLQATSDRDEMQYKCFGFRSLYTQQDQDSSFSSAFPLILGNCPWLYLQFIPTSHWHFWKEKKKPTQNWNHSYHGCLFHLSHGKKCRLSYGDRVTHRQCLAQRLPKTLLDSCVLPDWIEGKEVNCSSMLYASNTARWVPTRHCLFAPCSRWAFRQIQVGFQHYYLTCLHIGPFQLSQSSHYYSPAVTKHVHRARSPHPAPKNTLISIAHWSS